MGLTNLLTYIPQIHTHDKTQTRLRIHILHTVPIDKFSNRSIRFNTELALQINSHCGKLPYNKLVYHGRHVMTQWWNSRNTNISPHEWWTVLLVRLIDEYTRVKFPARPSTTRLQDTIRDQNRTKKGYDRSNGWEARERTMKGVRKGLWTIRQHVTRKRIANNIESRVFQANQETAPPFHLVWVVFWLTHKSERSS